MIKIDKELLIAEYEFKTLAPSLNELYSASTYSKKYDRRLKKYVVKKIKGKARDADDCKKDYRDYISFMKELKNVTTIEDRVFLVWTPHTNNRKLGHYDCINFASNYKMIVDILVKQVNLFHNDDYRYISQEILNHPEITDKDPYIKLSIYRSEALCQK